MKKCERFFCAYFIKMIFISCLIPLRLYSNPVINDLENKLNSLSDKEKLSVYLTLDSLYLPSNPIKAIQCAEKAIAIAQMYHLKNQESDAYLYLAKSYGIKGEFQLSNDYVDKSLIIKETLKDKKGIASCYNIKANLNKINGDIKSSMEFYLKSIQIREEIKDSSGLSSSFNNLGILYRNLGNISKALDYYQKSLEISIKLKETSVLANTYKNIGNVYVDMKRTEEAKQYFHLSYEISSKLNDSLQMVASYLDLGNAYLEEHKYDSALYFFKKGYNLSLIRGALKLLPNYLNNIGVTYIKTNKLDSASFYLKKAREISEKVIDKNVLIATYLNLGNLYINFKDYSKAEYYLDIALKTVDSSSNKSNLIELYQNLAELYYRTGNYKEAYLYRDKYANLKDTVFDESLNQKIENIQISYSLDQKEKEIEILKKDNQILETNQEIHNQERLYLLILSIFVVLIGIVIYSRYRSKIKANKLLTDKNTEIVNQSIQLENINTEMNHQFQFLQMLMDSIPNPIFYKNDEGVYMGCNKLFEEFTGHYKSELIGKTAFDFLDEQHAELTAAYDEEVITKVPVKSYIIDLKDNKDKPVIVEYYKSRFYDAFGNVGGIIGVIHDITYLKKNEKSLEESKERLLKLNEDKDKYLQIIENDLTSASDYIYSQLPKQIVSKGIKTRWHFVPSSQLGGDSFGYHWIDEDNFAIYLFDVSGHGIGAALHSVAVLNSLKHQTLSNADYYSPKDVLNKLNNIFQMRRHNNMFFTIWYGVYNIRTREMKYSSAGHPPALYIYGNDKNRSLSQKNPFLGGINDFDFVEDKLVIEKNSIIYIYSDGVYEILKNEDGTIWEQSQLNDYLLDNYYKSNDSEIVQLYKYVIDLHGSQHLDDDFSLLKIEFDYEL